MDVQTFTFLQRRGAPIEWIAKNPILGEGEMGVELLPEGQNKFKIGDGVTPWLELDYYVTEDGIAGYVAEALSQVDVGVPELPDLTLLWENAIA